jgi:Clathrin light chain
MSEDDFFAVPPVSEPTIVLGPPPDSYGDFSAPPLDYDTTGDFASPPIGSDYDGGAAYVGDVNETFGGGTAMDDPFGSPPEVMDADDTTTAVVPVSTGPSPMQIWNDEWQATLLVRKEEENTRRAELLEEARVALEAFQKERELKRETIMTKNREDEQAKLEAIEADLENDNSWQRVCKMVELQHESTDKSQDVKRMRDVMILLKNDTTKAAALSV